MSHISEENYNSAGLFWVVVKDEVTTVWKPHCLLYTHSMVA